MRSATMLFLAGVCTISAACGGDARADGPTSAPAVQNLAIPDGFWDHWGDGRAEVAGYRVKTSRYGELREGRTTLVTVTERFTEGQLVKSDGGHPDEFPVLKVNRITDFQTGIYDYNVMTSTFLRLDRGPLGEPVKVSMSMQEWCGHVYEQLTSDARGTRWVSHSYFDGEADRDRPLERHPDGIVLDALPTLVRGLTGDLVGPGQQTTVPALPTLEFGRRVHREPVWTRMTVTRSMNPETVVVPAGSFVAHTVSTDVEGIGRTTWYVEDAWPHRLVKWESSRGEVGELLGVERRAYWNESRNGGEAALKGIGLPPAPSLWRD